MTPIGPEAPRALTDEEKRWVLPGLMRLNGYFLRAWKSGMLVANTSSDRAWLQAIEDGITLPTGSSPTGEDLVPLTEAEKLELADRALVRFNLFREAFDRGMIVATDEAQQEILDVFAAQWAKNAKP